MKRLAAIALASAIALPACAQRRGGGGHAGFAPRSASAFRSSSLFRGSFASPRSGFAPSAPFRNANGAAAPGVRYRITAPLARPTFYHHGTGFANTRRYGIRGYPASPYGSYVVGYLPSDLLDDSFENDAEYPQPAAQPDQSYYPQPDNGYPQPPPQPEEGYATPQPQPPITAPQPSGTSSISSPADIVTLIFKDGRPPEQIQNYLATSTTLTVIDGNRHHDIPVAELDVPATVKANRDIGVGFQLPTATP